MTPSAAAAAPLLVAIRVGPNRHVTGFLWREDIVVTSDQSLPAAASYSLVLANGALISAQPGPRDPGNNLAALRLDSPVAAESPPPAVSTSIGALVMAFGADFDGSPMVRLTTIYRFPRTAGADGPAIVLDLPGARIDHGGPVIDADGHLLGMAGVGQSGDAIVIPHGVIARFIDATADVDQGQGQLPAGLAAQGVKTSLPVPSMRALQPGLHSGGIGHARGRRGWLGVALQPITVPDILVQRAGQPTARQVVSITKGGPAERAGLRAGDVLLALDGTSTSGPNALRTFLAPERVGSQVEIRMMRDGVVHTARLTIAAQPD